MTTYAILIDLVRCLGCQACVAACKTGNELPSGARFIEIRETIWGEFPALQGAFVPHRCYHCADAACVAVCPTGALSKQDGLTIVNAAKCSGCAYCTDACPFGVPQIVDNRISKCTACIDRVEAGQEPWCVQTCPSQALLFGAREGILAEAHRRAAAWQTRYPDAQVYGESEAGGLGVVMVLPYSPADLGLPEKPQTATAVRQWQEGVQPASLGLAGLSLAVSGLAALVARRAHIREMAALENPMPVEKTEQKEA